MRRLKLPVVGRDADSRPATPIEIEMIIAAGQLPIGPSQPNRRRFITSLRQQIGASAREGQPPPSLSNAQIRFLARTLWRYRKRISPQLAVAAALKGGTEPSTFQAQAAIEAARTSDRMRYVEDVPEWTLPLTPPEPR
jgi:hypothetical protein